MEAAKRMNTHINSHRQTVDDAAERQRKLTSLKELQRKARAFQRSHSPAPSPANTSANIRDLLEEALRERF